MSSSCSRFFYTNRPVLGYYVSTILINESKEDREELKRRIRDTIRKFGADQLNPPANLILPMGGGYNQGYQQHSFILPTIHWIQMEDILLCKILVSFH